MSGHSKWHNTKSSILRASTEGNLKKCFGSNFEAMKSIKIHKSEKI